MPLRPQSAMSVERTTPRKMASKNADKIAQYNMQSTEYLKSKIADQVADMAKKRNKIL